MWALLAVAGSSACSEPNAVLELEVDLPRAPDDGSTATPRRYVFTQARRADTTSFDSVWQDPDDPDPISLDPAERTTDHISIETVGDDDRFDLNVRVRFCVHPACAAIEDDLDRAPRACFRVEHPFYVGEQTSLTLRIDEIPSAPCGESDAVRIDKCMVRGCASGEESSDYCGDDDRHLCEL